MVCVPLVASAPLQPFDAVQTVALVEDQVSVAEPPEITEVGLAERETVGGGGGAAPNPGSTNSWLVEPATNPIVIRGAPTYVPETVSVP
jgi:hypothetical protein